MKMYLAIAFTLLTLGIHTYLSLHYYEVKLGAADGSAACNISESLNCDAVAASQYSSFLGSPLSAWGAATSLLLLIFLAVLFFRLSSHPDSLKRWSYRLGIFTALASVVMFAISMSLLGGTWCLYCIFLYTLSFLNLEVLRRISPSSNPFSNLGQDLSLLVKSPIVLVLSIAFIPGTAYFTNSAFLQNFDARDLDKIVERSVSSWKISPVVDFNVEPSLTYGPDRSEATMVLAEFADFRCGHCKQAAPSISAFKKSHPDVRVEFYNFPLDGVCNEVIPNGSGLSCTLAKAVQCAGKLGKGWQFHDSLFQDQTVLYKAENLNDEIKTYADKYGLDWAKLSECLDSTEALEAIKSQAKMGKDAGVKGTPSFYVNGKNLTRGQLIPVLEGVLKELQKSK